jgi:MFS family permease
MTASLPSSSRARASRLLSPWRDIEGLPSSVWIVFTTTLVNRAGSMVLPFMVLYVTRHLGVRPAFAGVALTVYGIGGLISGPIAGRLCDRFGAFAVLRASLLVSGLILLAFPLARSFELFLVVTVIYALVAESVRPASLAALTSYVRPEQRKPAIAVNRLAINLGMSIGPAIGGFLAAVSFPLLFVVDGITSLVAGGVLATLLVLRPIAALGPATRVDVPADSGRRSMVLRDPRALIFLLGVFLMGVVFYQHEGAMPIFLVRDLHYATSFYGILFAVNTVLIVLVEVPLNLAMQHWSHRSTLVLGAALFAIGFGSMAVLHSVSGLVFAAVLWTFGEMIAIPASGAYAAAIAPPGRSGAYAGAYSSTFSLALLVGPWAGTAALDRFGGAVLWSAALVIGLLGAAVFLGTRDSGLGTRPGSQ